MSERQPTGTGPGRVLVGLYAVFTIAAGSRSAVQIATRFGEAPMAYVLSAVAAGVYAVMTVGLARGGRISRRVAWAGCLFELCGVLVVGTVSLWIPDAFPDATVWSAFGAGYLFIPLALPLVGLLWLRKTAEPHSVRADHGR